MKKIPLTRGLFALVDDDLHAWLSQWKWTAKPYPSGHCYAVRTRSKLAKGRKRGLILMHRQILGLETGDGFVGDHADRNTLNNQRSNLRIASFSQNNMNAGKPSHNKSGFKGVCKFKGRDKFYAQCQGVYLGSFDDPAIAHQAYCKAAREMFGEFARFS